MRALGLARSFAVFASIAAALHAQAGAFVLPAGEITPDRLLGLAALHLHVNILQSTPMKGPPFVFVEPVRTDASGCLQLVEDRLFERNLVLVPVDPQLRIYRVVSLRGPAATVAAAAALFLPPDEVRPGSRRMVLTVVPVTNGDAVSVAGEVGAKAAPGPGLQLRALAAPNLRSVLLCGRQDDVAAAIARVRELDQPHQTTATPVASDLAAKLDALGKQIADLEQQVQALKQGR